MALVHKAITLDGKNKANEAQYDLDREAVKQSSALLSSIFEKYEYLTGEDLALKPGHQQRKS